MCHRCVAKVEKVLSAVAGVESAEVDLAAKRAVVLGTAAAAELIAACEAVGKPASLLTAQHEEAAAAASDQSFGLETAPSEAPTARLIKPESPSDKQRRERRELVSQHPSDGGESATAILAITGMTCAACVGAVERALQAVPGVYSVSVSLMGGRGHVSYEPGVVTPSLLAKQVRAAGFEASPLTDGVGPDSSFAREASMWRCQFLGSLVFSVPVFFVAMVLPHTPVRGALAAEVMPGLSTRLVLLAALVTPVQFGFGFQFYRGACAPRSDRTRAARTRAACAARAGREAERVHLALQVQGAAPRHGQHGRARRARLLRRLRVLGARDVHRHLDAGRGGALAGVLRDGVDADHLHPARRAARAQPPPCAPPSLSATSSAARARTPRAQAASPLPLAGKTLESTAKRKTSESIAKLVSLQPPSALRCDGDAEVTVPVAELRSGDVVKVLPGGQVPVDGTVVRGASEVDESMLTGEPCAH